MSEVLHKPIEVSVYRLLWCPHSVEKRSGYDLLSSPSIPLRLSRRTSISIDQPSQGPLPDFSISFANASSSSSSVGSDSTPVPSPPSAARALEESQFKALDTGAAREVRRGFDCSRSRARDGDIGACDVGAGEAERPGCEEFDGRWTGMG